ncbi:hypothetical protein POX_a01507 [Penicillium oxalicum]|nr:hypothetical protein POX_a01507 [Penicillium oxalicum]KAI2794906.1 hypothetical protein POX_a01507 [Penicillium oxalicum]
MHTEFNHPMSIIPDAYSWPPHPRVIYTALVMADLVLLSAEDLHSVAPI